MNEINNNEIRSKAWTIFKGKFWNIIGAFLLIVLVQIAFSVINTFIAEESLIVSFLITLINIYVLAALTIGLFKILFDLDDGKEFNIGNLFIYFTRVKECIIPAIIEFVLGAAFILALIVLFMIFLVGDMYSLKYAYPYVSENMLYSVLASMAPKLVLFIFILGIIFSFLNVIPLCSYAIAAKGDKRILKDLFSNSFKIGFKNIKYYILMCLFFLAIAVVMFFLYIFIMMMVSVLAMTSLWPVGILFILVMFICAFLIFIWGEISNALLCKKFVEKEIEFRYEQFNNYFNGYDTNVCPGEYSKDKENIIDVSQGVQDTNKNYESSNNSMDNENQSHGTDMGSADGSFNSDIDVDNKSDFVSVDTWVKGDGRDKDDNKLDLSSEQGELDIEELKRMRNKDE